MLEKKGIHNPRRNFGLQMQKLVVLIVMPILIVCYHRAINSELSFVPISPVGGGVLLNGDTRLMTEEIREKYMPTDPQQIPNKLSIHSENKNNMVAIRQARVTRIEKKQLDTEVQSKIYPNSAQALFDAVTTASEQVIKSINGKGALIVPSELLKNIPVKKLGAYQSETVFNFAAMGIKPKISELHSKQSCIQLNNVRLNRPRALDYINPMNRKHLDQDKDPKIGSISAKCYLTLGSRIQRDEVELHDRVCMYDNLCVQGGRFYGYNYTVNSFPPVAVYSMGRVSDGSFCNWYMSPSIIPEKEAKEHSLRRFRRPVIFIHNNSRNQLARVLTVAGVYDALDMAGLWPPAGRIEIVLMKDESPVRENEKQQLLPFFNPKVFHIEYSGTWMNPKGHATCFDKSVVGVGGPYYSILHTRDNRTIAETSRKYPDTHTRLQTIIPRMVSEFNSIHGEAKIIPCTAMIVLRGKTRQIKNRMELIRFIESYGYHVTPHDFVGQKLLDQKLISRTYEVIIGMHGAGLVNMIFSANTSLIELHPYKHSKETYSALYSYTSSPYYAWYNTKEKNSYANKVSSSQTNDHYFWKQRHQYVDLESFRKMTWERYLRDQKKRNRGRVCRLIKS
eukprot:CFRG6113T1